MLINVDCQVRVDSVGILLKVSRIHTERIFDSTAKFNGPALNMVTLFTICVSSTSYNVQPCSIVSPLTHQYVFFLLLFIYTLFKVFFTRLRVRTTIANKWPPPSYTNTWMTTNRGLETQMRLESLVLFFSTTHSTAPTTSMTMPSGWGSTEGFDVWGWSCVSSPLSTFFLCTAFIALLNVFFY
jgi:hypothetical protein